MNKIKEKYLEIKNKYFTPLISKVTVFFDKHTYLKVFSLVFILAFIAFLPITIKNGLTLPMSGDYCLQQLHFYVDAHHAFWHFFKTGEVVMWNSTGFLGVNYFAANTFYYLTSPFLLPFIFTPPEFIPQMIYIMFLVKIATGGLFFYILLNKYHAVSDKASLLGAIAYGLCGWGMYYLWFNHFHDVLALFPLLLIGIEHVLQHKKGWILSLSLMLVGMANYFFLFGFAIMGIFYALFRYFRLFKQNKGQNLKIIGNGILYYLLGICMVAYVLLPAFEIVGDVGRVENSNYLLNLFSFFFIEPSKNPEGGYILGGLKSWAEFSLPENLEGLKNYIFLFFSPDQVERNLQYFFTPLSQTLFMPINNFDATLFQNDNFDNFVSSMFISAPLLLLLVVKMIETIKKHNILSIIGMVVCISLPFIPLVYLVLNAFTLFYGRWELFLVAIMLINAIPLIDKFDNIPKWELDVSFITIFSLMFVCVYISLKLDGLEFSQYRHIYVLVYIAYFILVYIFLRNKKTTGEGVYERFALFVTIELVVCGFVAAVGQGTQNYWTLYGGQDRLDEQREIFKELNEIDKTFYRVENALCDRNHNNLAMTLNYNGVGTFHSVYDKELFDFINTFSRASYSYENWSMGIDEKRAYLDQFIGIKYLVNYKENKNVPFGYKLHKSYNFFNVYENENFIELGTSFTEYSLLSKYNYYFYDYTHFEKEADLLQLAVIKDKDQERIKELLPDGIHLSGVSNKFRTNPEIQYQYISRETDDEDSSTFTSFSSLANHVAEKRNGNLYGPWYELGLPGDIIKVTSKYNNTPIIPEGNNHIVVRLCYGSNAEVRMYNKDNELLVSDTHGINNYGKNGDHKYARGFYANEAVYRIEIELKTDSPISLFTRFGFAVYYESYEDYLDIVEENKKYAVKNVKHTKNTYSFDTDYTTNRLVVLQVPYDKGWTLKNEENEVVEMFSVDGGFIGFVSESGNHSYHLSYFTPSLMKGIALTGGSSLIYLILTFSSFYVIRIEDKKLKVYKKEAN